METLTTAALVFGLTQKIKDFGWAKGNALAVIAVIIGAVATYIQYVSPEAWEHVSLIAVSLGVTGGVSYVNEKAKTSPSA